MLPGLRGAGIMAESIIEGLWEYLKGCPLLAEFTVGVNFHKDDIDSAGIVEDNTEPIRKYVSGSELKALHASLFLGSLSAEDFQRIQTSAFLEDLRKWFKNASAEDKLPELPEGYSAQDISMGNAVPFEYGENGAKCTYQMNITLEYIEEE